MNKKKNNLGRIFSFTFRQHAGRRGYRIGTAAGVLLCFLMPLFVMVLMEMFSDDEEAPVCQAGTVYVVDSSEQPLKDMTVFAASQDASVKGVEFVTAPDFETAYQNAEAEGDALVLAIDRPQESYQVTVIRPEASELAKEDAEALEAFVDRNFRYVLLAKTGLSEGQVRELNVPVAAAYGTEAKEDRDPMAEVQEILGMLLPYLNIMILYFLILFYGQSVSACVLMEKTSKLMDTFLITVRPGELLLGKVLGTVLAAFLQVALWLAALAGGFAAGMLAVRQINPQTDMLLIQIFDGLQMFGGLFSISGFLLGCAIILAGFLLYCALASIGGALAGKSEDLSTTSVLYVLVLIVSFFCTLSGTKPWMDWVPFTAVLVTPGRMLAGQTGFVQGLGSLAVILLSSLVIVYLAGRIYSAMALYKGNIPKAKQVLAMLRKK